MQGRSRAQQGQKWGEMQTPFLPCLHRTSLCPADPSLRNAALWGESWAGVSYHSLWKSTRLGCVDTRPTMASRGTLWHLHQWLTNILPRCAFPEPDNPTNPDCSTVPFQKRDPRLSEIRRPSGDLRVEWWTPQYGPSDACGLCQSSVEMT